MEAATEGLVYRPHITSRQERVLEVIQVMALTEYPGLDLVLMVMQDQEEVVDQGDFLKQALTQPPVEVALVFTDKVLTVQPA
jgi:hypothetical protein